MYVEEPEKQNKQRMDSLKLAVHSLFVLAVFDCSPPANGGYAGGRPTFRSLCSDEDRLAGEEPANYRCPPVWEASPEERTQSVAQLRSAAPQPFPQTPKHHKAAAAPAFR